MQSLSEVKLSKVGFIMLGVKDLQRSLVYYRDTLGLTVRMAFESFVFLDGGGVTLVLRGAPNLGEAGDSSRYEVVFEVADIDAAHRSLQARGVAFAVEPRAVTADRFAANFRDPDGHGLSIYGPRVSA